MKELLYFKFKFENQPVICLANALGNLKHLEKLNLSGMRFCNLGVLFLADSLKGIDTLKSISFSYEKSENISAITLLNAIKRSKNLTQITLNGMRMYAEGISGILDLLVEFSSLKSLHLNIYSLETEAKELISEYCKRNNTVTIVTPPNVWLF